MGALEGGSGAPDGAVGTALGAPPQAASITERRSAPTRTKPTLRAHRVRSVSRYDAGVAVRPRTPARRPHPLRIHLDRRDGVLRVLDRPRRARSPAPRVRDPHGAPQRSPRRDPRVPAGVRHRDRAGVRERDPLDRFWLVVSLAAYLAVLAVGFAVFGPVVRRELAALERGGIADPDYLRLRRQAQLLSLGTIAALAMILALMVAKPT
ncbi:MAG TPA: DUF2269 family protein [Candidatus Limnocylindria bacterium]|nr:DUF2269 family protein [Candidatus Limnocylindria bacterium]